MLSISIWGQTDAKALVRVQNAIREYRESAIGAPFFVNHDMGRAAGYLSVDGSEVTLKGDTVTMPPYSAVILR